MVVRGRYRLFAGVWNEYSARTIDLIGGSIVIDMLGLLTLDWTKLKGWQEAPQTFTQRDYQRFSESGITVFHPAVELNAEEPHSATARCFESWRRLISANSHLCAMESRRDFENAKRSGRIGILLGSQNSNHFRTPGDVRMFHGQGQRVSQLTYNFRNRIGSGCLERNDQGLTEFGHAIVAAMNRCGMAVDVSHSGERTTLEAFEASRKPVLVTHSNCLALADGHPRCKSDEVIRKLGSNGGVMGITGVRSFVRNQDPTTIEHVLDHFDRVVRLAGVEHVGIGSDTGLDGRAGGVRRQRRSPDIAGLDHPRRIFDLTEGLVRRKYNDREIQLILGGNFLRTLTEIWTV
jgi:membrane dipeptidase